MTAPVLDYGVAPPPAEALAVTYFAPLMRVESAGGFMRTDELLFDISVILHSYGPENQETVAETNLCTALGYGARGVKSFTITVDGNDWWVAHSWVTAAPLRQNDPLVNMTRYRAMLTWRIPGQGIGVPSTQITGRRGKLNHR